MRKNAKYLNIILDFIKLGIKLGLIIKKVGCNI